MKVSVVQVYIRENVNFPFTYLMQVFVSEELTALAHDSAAFHTSYGPEYELIINMSAKRGINDNEVRGPTVFRKGRKTVEYSIFLPFDTIVEHPERLRLAMQYLLDGVKTVFRKLRIDTSAVEARAGAIIEHVCSRPEMLDQAHLPPRGTN